MNDDVGGAGSAGRAGRESIGGVGEEAAKLIATLQDWAKAQLPGDPLGGDEHGGAHISDGSAACNVCPLCQLIAFARNVNPDTIDQLGNAATSFVHALAGLIESTQQRDTRRQAPVQKIDLADGDADEDEPADAEEPGP